MGLNHVNHVMHAISWYVKLASKLTLTPVVHGITYSGGELAECWDDPSHIGLPKDKNSVHEYTQWTSVYIIYTYYSMYTYIHVYIYIAMFHINIHIHNNINIHINIFVTALKGSAHW